MNLYAITDWVHEARDGVVRLPGRLIIRQDKLIDLERNAFEIGRDYQADQDRRTTQPLTSALADMKRAKR